MTLRGWQGLRNAVLGVFVIALLLGMFLPVYTDEVGWRFQERAAIDGVDKLYSDNCGPNTLARPPVFMMPVRTYSAVFNTAFANPTTIRLSGILYALIWLAMLLALLRRVVSDERDRSLLTICGLGLMSLGTLPVLLVMSRPEQPILIAALGALLIAWSDWRSPDLPTPARKAWLRSGAMLLVAVVALSYHLKGVFLLPLFLACLWLASRGREAVPGRLVVTVCLVVLTAWSAQHWSQRMQCPGDPIFWGKLSRSNLAASLSAIRHWSDVPPVIVRVVGNVDLVTYFSLPAPKPNPMSRWLAAGQVTQAQYLIGYAGLVCLWAIAAFAAFVSLAFAGLRSLREKAVDRRVAVSVVLWATALGWSATQLARNVYEASFVLPIVMLAILFALAVGDDAEQNRGRAGALKGLAGLLGIGGVVSIVAIAAIFGPSLGRAAGERGYVAGQRNSLSVVPYRGLERDVLATARLCRIPAPEQAKSLMIDDLTYLVFMESRLPQHQLGVVGVWKGTIADPVAYLKRRGSDGIVVGCHLLPPDLRARARQNGAFCCLAPPNW